MEKKVTFILPSEALGEATEAILLGDFNNWDVNEGIGLKVQKDGTLKATVALEAGKSYEYRFLLNDGRWVNDWFAENYVHKAGLAVDNCVITVPEVVEAEQKLATSESEPKPVKKAPAKKAATEKKVATAKKKAEKPAVDDLTKIEGIGKKIAELLIADAIVTYTDLSKATPKKLRGILDAAGNKFKVHDPSSWPKQAKLAAAAKWSELEALQDELKAGK